MKKLNSTLKVTGHIKATVIRANGERFVHCDEHNTIQSGLLNHLAGILQTSTDKALNKLFTASAETAPSGYDGIAYNDPVVSGDSYAFQCTGTSPVTSFTLGWSGTGASRKLTGAFTGSVVVFTTAAYVELGFNHDGTYDFATLFATASSWASLTLAAADVVVIEWTITVS